MKNYFDVDDFVEDYEEKQKNSSTTYCFLCGSPIENKDGKKRRLCSYCKEHRKEAFIKAAKINITSGVENV